MTFTDPQLEKIDQHTEEYGPLTCPSCGSESWTTFPHPGAIVVQQKESVNIYKSLQVVQHVCDRCGFVAQFAASKLGLEQEAEDPKSRNPRRPE